MLGVCASGLLEDALKKLEKKRPDEKPKRANGKAKGAATRKSRKLKISTRRRKTASGAN
jgi:hypothetical protein